MKTIVINLLVMAACYPLQVFSQPTQSNVPYGSHPLQKLDYYSASGPNFPIIIVVHGGGWWRGDKSGRPYADLAQLLKDEGYAVVNINYRLTPAVTFPSHISDLACAIAWIKKEEFGSVLLSTARTPTTVSRGIE